ncbi:MAG: YDG domain-containing protein, partial [Clostridiales bacterium]|nr:YDG domain-containing protein [Clostridiales bacterium]
MKKSWKERWKRIVCYVLILSMVFDNNTASMIASAQQLNTTSEEDAGDTASSEDQNTTPEDDANAGSDKKSEDGGITDGGTGDSTNVTDDVNNGDAAPTDGSDTVTNSADEDASAGETDKDNTSENISEEENDAVPMMLSNDGEEENTILVNGSSAKLDSTKEEKFSLAFLYKDSLTFAVTGSDILSTNEDKYYYLSEEDKKKLDANIEDIEFTEINSDTVLIPGNYYILYYSAKNTKYYFNDYTQGIQIQKINIAVPGNLAWGTGEDARKATWTAPTVDTHDNAMSLDSDVTLSYKVYLYRNNEETAYKTVTTDNTYYDFSSEMTSYGTYTFSVQAIVKTGTDRYADSWESDVSESYGHVDSINPEIISFMADSTQTKLTAVAKDNVGIAKYAFVKADSKDGLKKPDTDSTIWQMVDVSKTGADKETTITSDIIKDSGFYALYVMDAQGNVAASTSIADNEITNSLQKTIVATKVLIYQTLSKSNSENRAELDSRNATGSKILFGDDATFTLEIPTLAGFEFEGWYTTSFYVEGEQITDIKTELDADQTTITEKKATIKAGADFSVYAKWKEQDSVLTLTTSANSQEYNGTANGSGIILRSAFEKNIDNDSISFSWYKQNGENWDLTGEPTDAVKNGYNTTKTLYQVAESGTYKVVATIRLGEEILKAESEPVTVIIQKKKLSVTASDMTIHYGDAKPDNSSFSFILDDSTQTEGLVEGETLQGLIDADSLTLGDLTTDYDPDNSSTAGVGSYRIYQAADAGKKAAADNYDVTVKEGTLKVEPKEAASSENIKLYFDKGEGAGTTDRYTNTFSTEYTGNAIQPEIAVFDENTLLIENVDYELKADAYQNNVSASTDISSASITVTFKGNYTGTRSLVFTITKQSYTTNVLLKDNGTVVTNPSWYYGETGNVTADVEDNRSGMTPVYFYAAQSNGTALDRNTAKSKMPEDAGTYYVWAVIPAGDNHEEVVTEAYSFEIKKRPITITAISYCDDDADTAHNAWAYDGKPHSDDSWTQTGMGFVSPDGFKSVSVSGSITNLGTATNKITYELTPNTKASNYDIKPVDGTLQVKAVSLTIPSNFGWNGTYSNGGILTWTPLSQANLDINYTVKLYRLAEGSTETNPETDTLLETYEGAESKIDFTDVIRTNSEKNGIGGYYAVIQANPVGGTAKDNYQASVESEPSKILYTLKLKMEAQSTSISEAYFIKKDQQYSNYIVLQGESVQMKASSNKGYDAPKWKSNDPNVSLSVTSDTKIAYVSSRLNGAFEYTISVWADDTKPKIDTFTITNDDTEGYKSVKFAAVVKDIVGMGDNGGYALYELTAEDSEKIADGNLDESYWTGTAGVLKNLTYQAFKDFDNTKNQYSVTDNLKETGSYILAVKDKAGNIVHSSVTNPVTIYQVTFDNGKQEGEADNLYGGTNMPTLYKVANSSIILPANTYTKTGYAFKNWEGLSENGGTLYNDQASYAANASDILSANWSNEEYSYTVEYYYMNTEGSYEGVTPETAVFKGSYGEVISSNTAAIEQNRTGFELDTREDYVDTITLGKESTEGELFLKVYYQRKKYTLSFVYTNPEDVTKTITHRATEYYYEQEYQIPEDPVRTGYTFSGWNWGDFDTSNKKMPAKDLNVTGSFTPDVVTYTVVQYIQGLPTVTGSFAENNYEETPSSEYCVYEQTNYISIQGQKKTYDVASAPDIEGFTAKYVSASEGSVGGATAPASTSATGTVDATEGKHLYINVYYVRNIYDITLTVWKDKRDIEGNAMYTKSWRVSYGYEFMKGETDTLAGFGYDEDDTKNAWIRNYMETKDGKLVRKSEFASYILAEYTDWSTGVAPSKMPAGPVSITKEYVEKTTAGYQVEFYMQEVDSNNQVVYPEEPTYSIYYYDSIGKTVTLSATDTADDADVVLNYATIGNMLDSNFEAYELDVDNTQNNLTGKIVTEKDADGKDQTLVLKIYFKRSKTPSLITYIYRDAKGNDQTIAQYYYYQEWGTDYTFDPTKFFYGKGNLPDETNTDYEDIKTDDNTLLSTDFNAKKCAISYSGRYYISNWSYPNKRYTLLSELETSVSTQMGKGVKGNNETRMTIYYSELDPKQTYYMDVAYAANSQSTLLTETEGENGLAITDTNGTSIINNTDAMKDIFYIRIANEKDIFNTTDIEGTTSEYNAESILTATYSKGETPVLKEGFQQVTVKTSYGTDTYYLKEDGDKKYLYICNTKNSFYAGNYLYFNTENTEYCNNAAKLGRAQAEKLVNSGYALYYNTGYGIIGKEDLAAGHRNWNYYQQKKDQQRIIYNFGSKTTSKYVDYDTNYKLSEDDFVTTSFTVDDGYQIVWYEDADCTIPVGDKSYKITAEKTFYGRREKELIPNQNYVSYEFSDTLAKNTDVIHILNGKTNNKYYLTESNKDRFSWNEIDASENRFTTTYNGSANTYEKVTTKLSKTYMDNQFTDSAEKKTYEATRISYYINGELVLIQEDNSSLTYMGISLDYTDPLYNFDVGFAYDDRDTNNKTQGYCQKEPVSLNAYYYRKNFNLNVTKPSDVNDRANAISTSVCVYGLQCSEKDPTKKGYEFNGYAFYHMTTDSDGTATKSTPLTEAELKAISYKRDAVKGEITFTMPNYDLALEAQWTPTKFTYDLVSYFETAEKNYDTARMTEILRAEENDYKSSGNLTIELEQNTSDEEKQIISTGARIIYNSAEQADANILAVAYDVNVAKVDDADTGIISYYFVNPKISEDSKIVTVTSDALVGSKTGISLVSDTTDNQISKYLANVSAFGMFGYAYTSYQTATKTATYGKEDAFTADASMVLNHYYSRQASYSIRTTGATVESTVENVQESGVTTKGDTIGLYYGEKITLQAQIATGYEFLGWFKAGDVLANYGGTGSSIDKNSVLKSDVMSENSLSEEYAAKKLEAFYNETTKTYDITVSVEGSRDYVAVTKPLSLDAADTSVTLTAGNTDYTYGYKDNSKNYIQANVTIAAEQKDLISITGYQWYKSNETGDLLEIITDNESATSPTYLVKTGLKAGIYYYQCVVSLKRTDNGKTATIKATEPCQIVVKKYGVNKSDIPYYTAKNMDTYYNGTANYIECYVNAETYLDSNKEEKHIDYPLPKKYQVYYSKFAMDTWSDVQNGLQNGTVYLGQGPEASYGSTGNVPNEVKYTDVELDAEGKTVSHTVYFYIRTEQDDLDPNFADQHGNRYVKIEPIPVILSATSTPFTKTYDAKKEVQGSAFDTSSDFYRLINGETDAENQINRYVDVINFYLDKETNWTIAGKAEFNEKDVDNANSVRLSELKVVYKEAEDGHTAGEINKNYQFTEGYSCSITGYINPYPLQLAWDSQDTFVYDGNPHAVSAHLKEETSAPDADLEIISLGQQTNVNDADKPYLATASLNVAGKSYTLRDYTFDIDKKTFSILPCLITVAPKDTAVTYTGKKQYISTYEITKPVEGVSTTKEVSADGSCETLPSGQKLDLSKIQTTAGYKDVNYDSNGNVTGYEGISVENVRILANNTDVTYNYQITPGTGTLTIEPKALTVSGIKAEDKEYDGNTAATLETEEKVITSEDSTETVSVLKDVTLIGLESGDDVAVLSEKVTDVKFAQRTFGENINVTFDIGDGALCGADAKNYFLNVADSQKEATAKITKCQIVVSVKSLSAETIYYGETPAYAVTFTGFKESDDEAVIRYDAPITYLLDGKKYDTYSYPVGEQSIIGTKIPYKDGGYTITLETDENGYVKGLSADNYVFVPDSKQIANGSAPAEQPAKLVITKRPVSITAIDRGETISKVYDGTTNVKAELVADTDYQFENASADGSNSGLLPEDTITLQYSAAYNSAKVAEATTITADHLSLTSAEAGNNYSLLTNSFSVNGKITKKTLNVVVNNQEITYGDFAPSYKAEVSGFVDADGEESQTLTDGEKIHLACDYNTEGSVNREVKEGGYSIIFTSLGNDLAGNYEVLEGNVTQGTLMVKPKEVQVIVENQNYVYGKDIVPEDNAFSITTKGWTYDDKVETVLGTDWRTKVETTLPPMDNRDYPYKEGGYTITIKTDDKGYVSGLSAANYIFKPVNGNMTIEKQFISITGITTGSKIYDGKDTVTKINYDPEGIIFHCYVSGGQYTTNKIQSICGRENPTNDDLIKFLKNNLSISGTYLDTTNGSTTVLAKDVGTGKNVSLKVALIKDSYLAQRYELIGSDMSDEKLTELAQKYSLNKDQLVKTQSTTNDGVVEKRPVALRFYYFASPDDQNNSKSAIKYGEKVDAGKFTYKLVNNTSFADGEGIEDLNMNVDSLEKIYQIVDKEGNPYTETSGVGTYFIKMVDNALSDEGTNYALTVLGSQVEGESSSPIVVEQNTLETPQPVWSAESPGTITWDTTKDIGGVKACEYQIALYKNGVEESNLIESSGQTIAVTDELDTKGYTFDYAKLIREQGPGQYFATIQAIATSTNESGNNPDKKNVTDSEVGKSAGLYAAKVTVAYSTDPITVAGATTVSSNATQNQGESSSITIGPVSTIDKNSNSYTFISGESGEIIANWYNENGYRSGYDVKEQPWTMKFEADGTNTTQATLAAIDDKTNTAQGTYSAKVKLELISDQNILLSLSLKERPATLNAAVIAIKDTATYGYESVSGNAPEYKVEVNPEDGDSISADQYSYTYQWQYKTYVGQWQNLENMEGENDVKQLLVKAGIPALTSYYVKCVVTARRPDNNANEKSVTVGNMKTNIIKMDIKKASVGGENVKVSVDNWKYGEQRNTCELSSKGSGSIPDGIGTIHYYYSTDNSKPRTEWTEWTDSNTPKDADTYYIYASVDASENYEAFTTNDTTTFIISQNELGKKVENEDNLSTVDLAMAPSASAPYGIATWPAVEEPKENGDSTTNYVTAGYQVILYRYPNKTGIGESAVEQVKAYETTDVIIDKNTHTCRVDMSSEMNQEGVYYYTVQAVSSNQQNCANSAVIQSTNYTIYDTLQVKDSSGNSLLDTSKTKAVYTYDGRNITLSVGSSATGETYQWYKGNTPLDGKTENTLQIMYVEDSAIYSCQTKVGEVVRESTHVNVMIQPREITVMSDSPTKQYDGTPLKTAGTSSWTISGEGLATGDTISYSGEFSSLTQVGEQDNKVTNITISRMESDNTKTVYTYNTEDAAFENNNYKVTKINGKLKVTARTLGNGTAYTDGISVENISDVTYNGTAQEPDKDASGDKVIVKDVIKDANNVELVNTTLVKGTDYTVSYTNNINAGTATVVIQGKGNYSGRITKTFTIKKQVVEPSWGTFAFVYDGNQKTITAEVNNKVGEDDVSFT